MDELTIPFDEHGDVNVLVAYAEPGSGREPMSEAETAALREALAEAIYDAMRENDPEGRDRPWVPGGNSHKQDEARRRADRALAATEAVREPAVREPEAAGWHRADHWTYCVKCGELWPCATARDALREPKGRDAEVAGLDVERLARAIDIAGTWKQDDDDWNKTRQKYPSELARDIAVEYARLAPRSTDKPEAVHAACGHPWSRHVQVELFAGCADCECKEIQP